MLRCTEWDEITGIECEDANADTSEALWKVPASKIKQELHLRTDEAFDHPVPLSTQAVDTLRAVRWLTGRAPFVFPGARSGLKPISENAIGYPYNRKGYNSRRIPHGWRTSFLTIMNDQAELELGADVAPPRRSHNYRPDARAHTKGHERERVALQSRRLHAASPRACAALGEHGHARRDPG